MQAVTLGMPIILDGTFPLRRSTLAMLIVSYKLRKYIYSKFLLLF